jgi:redox-sensitive bicupin YhaK (pirin superfamily)
MSITHIPKHQQIPGQFAGGAIQELRPVIPGHIGTGGYGNLFYWARAWSEPGGLIDLHPHQGFEIMSVVLKGGLSHYDTLQKKWLDLHEGDVQIIRAGNGVSHAERILPGSEMFQIWFDPDLSVTLGEPASYSDHRASEFPEETQGNAKVRHLVGGGSPLVMRSKLTFSKMTLSEGEWQMDIPHGQIMSLFVLNGQLEIGSVNAQAGDFLKLQEEQVFAAKISGNAEVFCLFCPEKTGYRTYMQRLGTP